MTAVCISLCVLYMFRSIRCVCAHDVGVLCHTCVCVHCVPVCVSVCGIWLMCLAGLYYMMYWGLWLLVICACVYLYMCGYICACVDIFDCINGYIFAGSLFL